MADGVTKSDNNGSLETRIPTEQYNHHANQGDRSQPVVVEVNNDGFVDSGDRFFDPTAGELTGADASKALNSICDTMAPGKTAFDISPEAQAFFNEPDVIGTRGHVVKGTKGETLMLAMPRISAQRISIQSFGIFDSDNTQQCLFNKPGTLKIDRTKDGIKIEGIDSKGDFEIFLNFETSNPAEAIIEKRPAK